MRLEGKAGIVVGAGQSPGETVGTGRAAAVLFAREGAKVLLADRDLASARETAGMIAEREAAPPNACRRLDAERLIAGRWPRRAWTRGGGSTSFRTTSGSARGDGRPAEPQRGRVRPNHLGQPQGLPALLPGGRAGDARAGLRLGREHLLDRRARGCSPVDRVPDLEGRVNALSQSLAVENARARRPREHDHARTARHADGGRRLGRAHGRPARAGPCPARCAGPATQPSMGTGWDVAYASLFLHSDEARFITGALLPVDGGQLARVGG